MIDGLGPVGYDGGMTEPVRITREERARLDSLPGVPQRGFLWVDVKLADGSVRKVPVTRNQKAVGRLKMEVVD